MPQMASAPSNSPEPVVDASAPTIAELTKQGLARVDDEPAGASCGKDCTVDGFTAIYFGRKRDGPEADREYVCPVAEGEMDTWKCRRVVKS